MATKGPLGTANVEQLSSRLRRKMGRLSREERIKDAFSDAVIAGPIADRRGGDPTQASVGAVDDPATDHLGADPAHDEGSAIDFETLVDEDSAVEFEALVDEDSAIEFEALVDEGTAIEFEALVDEDSAIEFETLIDEEVTNAPAEEGQPPIEPILDEIEWTTPAAPSPLADLPPPPPLPTPFAELVDEPAAIALAPPAPTPTPEAGAIPLAPPEADAIPLAPPEADAIPLAPPAPTPEADAIPLAPPEAGAIPLAPPEADAIPLAPPEADAIPLAPPAPEAVDGDAAIDPTAIGVVADPAQAARDAALLARLDAVLETDSYETRGVSVVDVDLRPIDALVTPATGSDQPPNVVRYVPFLLRAMALATNELTPDRVACHIEISGDSVTSCQIEHVDLKMLPDVTGELLTPESTSPNVPTMRLRVASVGDWDKVDFPAGDVPTITFVHFARSGIGVLGHTGAAPSAPVDLWLTMIRDMLEKRSWTNELGLG